MADGIPRAVLCLALWTLLATAWAQQPDGAPPQGEDSPDWRPPPIAVLPLDWWAQFSGSDEPSQHRRLQRLYEAAEERVSGLGPDHLQAGQAKLANLRNLIELLAVAEQEPAGLQFEPIPTQDSYTLEGMLELRARKLSREREALQFTLDIDQSARKLQLLQDRRDSLLRQYQAASRTSPARLLLGLDRVSARIEYEIELLRERQLHAKLTQIEAQIDRLAEQESFARQVLDSSGASLEESAARVAGARSRLAATTERLAVLKRQLLDVVTAETVNTSLELLRNQQLTRASADASLAQLELALAEAKHDWNRLRAGEAGAEPGFGAAITEARRLSAEALSQIEVWQAASESTLVARPPVSGANAIGNFQIAQSVARDTLVMIEEIRRVSDELLLVRNIVSSELIAGQSGLSKAAARVTLAFGAFWDRLNRGLDFTLFSMGDAPVTPGGIIKMLLILVAAWGISWFIRHLLERLGRRKQFAKSPAMYTLGRLLHYLVITIGVFAALASIGLDFSNFALIAGALSVGIGFGLQAIVNNFVSGMILLFEGSLRVGDHIELDSGLAGVVREINTRATVVNTTDGVDVVVPNSELVTTKLTNWTLRESIARVRIGFGVAYGSDKERVKEAALLAAQEMEFVILNMRHREPQVRLVNFGDSALEFELLAWVSRQGVRRPHRVRASFLWALETRLGEAGIEIPFPQRDLHIRSDYRDADAPQVPENDATRHKAPGDRG